MRIDLNSCFPLSENTGTRGPLPKQQEFLDALLNPKSPSKFVAYVGGVGSGKTLIGCIAMISLAIRYPGDWLVARQYMPELKVTTLKTFLELCPPELIQEYRVADGIVKLKAVNGTSNIIFRQLDEVDKLRSLNLNGFYIDEASQVSEAAFMLLQGRLRGKYVRKGFLTSNPAGHDWIYTWFVKQDHFKNTSVKNQFHLIRAPSTENIHLPEGYIESMLNTWSPDRIKREIEGSFDAFEGQVYNEFRRDVHVIQPFVIPNDWKRVIGIDHGYRNPAAWIWGAVDYDENIYIYREFYEREWLIEEIIKGKPKENKPGVLALMRGEKIDQARIDPSTRNVRGTTGLSDFDTYIDHLPSDFPLLLANNEKTAGIDRVKSYLKVDPRTNKPRLFIFNTCQNLIEEMSQYRYKELQHGQAGKMNEKEDPVKVFDHACLAWNSLITTSQGNKPICQVRPGDLVLTRAGYKEVEVAGKTGTKWVWEYTLANGMTFKATEDHPIIVGNDKKPLKDLTHTDTVRVLNLWQRLFLTGLLSEKWVNTIDQTGHIAKGASNRFIAKFGNSIMGQSLKNIIFTTKMVIQKIMMSAIWSAYQPSNIFPNMLTHPIALPTPYEDRYTWMQSAPSQKNGTQALRGMSGTRSTASLVLESIILVKRLKKAVFSAARRIKHTGLRLGGLSTATQIVSKRPLEVVDVYNLQVKDQHEFYADGVLVSNCDALRYLIMSRPEAPKSEPNIWKKINYNSLEGSIYRELQSIRKPTPKDPFEDQ